MENLIHFINKTVAFLFLVMLFLLHGLKQTSIPVKVIIPNGLNGIGWNGILKNPMRHTEYN